MATEGSVPSAPSAVLLVPNVDKKLVEMRTGEVVREEALTFDPTALQERYLAERDKRLAQNLGVEQYTLLDGHLSHYLKDPWIKPGFERDSLKEETEVVIIGGGYGAQVCAVRLIEAGINNFRIIEKAGDFGGTWYVHDGLM